MEIYILRHGTTEWNKIHKIQGNTDTPLDETGKMMAEATGKAFSEKGVHFDRIYSSPLKRALVTTKLVTGREDIITDERLRELDFGFQEGRIVEEMIEKDMLFKYFKTDPARYDEEAAGSGSAETLTALIERAASFMKEVVEKLPPETERILISAHGACNKALLMYIRNEKDLSRFWGVGLQPNCGVDIVTYDFEKCFYQLKSSNNTFYPEGLSKNISKLL